MGRGGGGYHIISDVVVDAAAFVSHNSSHFLAMLDVCRASDSSDEEREIPESTLVWNAECSFCSTV